MVFKDTIHIRWSDLDPNFHVRHSAYYDWGAQQRINALNQLGLTMQVFQELRVGPILFREECVFRKEIKQQDVVSIELFMRSMNEDGSRWSMTHILTNQHGEMCATINIDGAWMDVSKRKLANPTPEVISKALQKMEVLKRDNE